MSVACVLVIFTTKSICRIQSAEEDIWQRYKKEIYFQSVGYKPSPLGGNVFSTPPFKGPA
ncbi:hypothetical protein BN873_p20055 [Candidatus Competibacter denitrificans Run_A_D11]|uniref:Uncharacterized protein n=1 Tax=Candidatus Competibacter denitrificans Run_A_D11 TaxID=1400863 RepID=W6MD70_9GAMM|nr:hypothetical protein BN873_p20055 [Candidatus Competibacter denitrificans Run_A_D11]